MKESRFDPGALGRPAPAPALALPEAPRGLKAAMPGAKRKHEQAAADATAAHERALATHQGREKERLAKLDAARLEHDELEAKRRAEHDAEVAQVDDFAGGVAASEPDALAEYFGLVLSLSRYPEEFPLLVSPRLRPRVTSACSSRSSCLALTSCLPRRSFGYVKARDEVTSTAASWPRIASGSYADSARADDAA